jgi:hypothetical protein
MPTADDFRDALFRQMYEGFRAGLQFIDVNAGQLHTALGNYPGPNHRMPVCCQVMRAAMAEGAGDQILEQPASGQGASLTIRYVLPRPA